MLRVKKLNWEPHNEVMGAFIVENNEILSIYPKGTHNGYIILGILHPCYGLDYEEINEELYDKDLEPPHGGITFGRTLFDFHREDLRNILDELYPGLGIKNINYHILGFDTCHLDDNEFNWNQEAVEKETIRFAETMAKIKE
ncbi:hypothetical protein [Gallibacterium anatis]|uniref:hypothetical protein n=1 Tax=Gallibacterium anatis TaxID=750 RepID=UPI002670BFD0|nr:hypothetical protein [Gallibacterium anatis]WKS98362.1 hypothetical protein NYR19_06225 [Gallibacterium anatis]